MLRFVFFLAVPCLIAGAIVSSADTGNENYPTARKDGGEFEWAAKSTYKCLRHEHSEMANCFGVKAVAVLDRASRMSTIHVAPGVAFVADSEELQRSGRALMTEEEIENSISGEPNEKASKLVDMLLDSISGFFQTHSLQLRMPKSKTSAALHTTLDEGRGKLKKKWMPYAGVLAVKLFSILPILLGVVGFLALKAFIFGKLALLVAGLLALQKYNSFGKLGDGFSAPGSIYTPASGPGPYYRRSIEDQVAAQQLAYNAHTSQQVSSSA